MPSFVKIISCLRDNWSNINPTTVAGTIVDKSDGQMVTEFLRTYMTSSIVKIQSVPLKYVTIKGSNQLAGQVC